jgi:hypothetical protein
MTREARLMAGIILITVPTIQYGGYFLLTSLMDKSSRYMENPLRQNFFRAGHAHAGVIVILSLICQMLADTALLPSPLLWFVRIGVPLSAILISSTGEGTRKHTRALRKAEYERANPAWAARTLNSTQVVLARQ